MENLLKQEKLILKVIYFVSAIVLLVVVILGMLPQSTNIPSFVKHLPKLNAGINAICSVLLIASFYYIRKRDIETHKKLNVTTFILSSIFLISYVIFHSFGIETRFPADNPVRPYYLIILISHIILAAIVLPLVLLSFYYGLTGKIATHRKLTRFSFPIWLYVTVTGVIVYLMISPYYSF
jgi:putative membrane protein